MLENSGLINAFIQIEQVLNNIEELETVNLALDSAADAPVPSLYLFWDSESLDIVGGDLKWIHPLNARAQFGIVVYVKAERNESVVKTLMRKVQLIKDAISEATATDGINWKGNVIRVAPLYGKNGSGSFAGAEITVLVGEYL